MQQVIDNFNNRVLEVEKYYKVIELLNDSSVTIKKNYRNYSRDVELDRDALKVLKSTCFLLLYNLIESSIRESFTFLYDQINTEPDKIENYNNYFKKLWLNQQFRNIDPVTSNQQSYKDVVAKIVEILLSGDSFNLNSKHLPISGNLDAKKIRTLFKNHDIQLKVHHRAFGGGELKTVKDHRNELSHGNISFTDCGRQYSLQQLSNIKKQTFIYLRSSLRYLKKYCNRKGYAV